MTWIERITNTVADRGRELLRLRSDSNQDTLADLCQRLVAGRGEATNIALAREILQRFATLDAEQKTTFFLMLAQQFGPDFERIKAEVAAFDQDRPETLQRLLEAVEPPRQELIRRLNMAPNGTASIVMMRAELLDRMREFPVLSGVDADFKHLLSSWFNRGFLRLQRLDWKSSAAILEKIMRYEAVHPIADWQDLHRRLAEDRRCFGFFHPALPEEPLVFVEVALTQQTVTHIDALINPHASKQDPYAADTAMFYSINNALRGLRGISFGNFLLKQVLSELSAELPALKRFVTLSPMPRFADSLDALLTGKISDWPLARVEAVLGDFKKPLLVENPQADTACQAVQAMLQVDVLAEQTLLGEVLARLALLYITALEKSPGICCDPVAAFHLANGAVLERINPYADRSANGLRRSYGVMVNYRYDPDQVVNNHEAFVHEGRIAMSRALQREYDRHIVDKQ